MELKVGDKVDVCLGLSKEIYTVTITELYEYDGKKYVTFRIGSWMFGSSFSYDLSLFSFVVKEAYAVKNRRKLDRIEI